MSNTIRRYNMSRSYNIAMYSEWIAWYVAICLYCMYVCGWQGVWVKTTDFHYCYYYPSVGLALGTQFTAIYFYHFFPIFFILFLCIVRTPCFPAIYSFLFVYCVISFVIVLYGWVQWHSECSTEIKFSHWNIIMTSYRIVHLMSFDYSWTYIK